MTVNRVCGSGAQAIVSAAQQIAARRDRRRHRGRHGEHGPRAVSDGRRPLGLSDGPRGNPRQHASRRPRRCVLGQAFRLAHRGPGHAMRSSPARRRTASPSARSSASAPPKQAGKFADEIVPVDIRGKKGVEAFATDEAPRPDTTFEGLTKLRPAFRRRRHDHGRQCARPQQRRGRDDRRRSRLCRSQSV